MWDKRIDGTWQTLRVVFGVVPIVAGLDKFFDILTDWQAYLSPLARDLLPMSPTTFMHVVGVIEIAAGVLVLLKPRIGGYVVAAWLVGIALNLVTTGRYFDVAVRDLVMAVAAFSLARLSEVREQSREPARRRAAPEPATSTGALPARA